MANSTFLNKVAKFYIIGIFGHLKIGFLSWPEYMFK